MVRLRTRNNFVIGYGAAKLQGDTANGADAPTQESAVRSKPPEPSPMAPVNGTERTLDLPPVEEKTLPAESHAQIDNRPPAVPSAPAQAQTPAEPLSMAAPSSRKKWRPIWSGRMAHFSLQTKPFKLVAVALANKMARIAFAIMRGKTSYSAAPA
jgi:hypothetical protein